MERKQHNSIGSITEQEYVGKFAYISRLYEHANRDVIICRDRFGGKDIGLLSLRLYDKTEDDYIEHRCLTLIEGGHIGAGAYYLYMDQSDLAHGFHLLPGEHGLRGCCLIYRNPVTGKHTNIRLGNSIRLKEDASYDLQGSEEAGKRMYPVIKERIETKKHSIVRIIDAIKNDDLW